ncbi:HlyD family efflux transporter periplasmic adaptor subunit [Azotobacter beijerinckii]|uniref:Peptide zinc metalloprotease protein n=1 Tax=Azotobacter beijerinckii TaxID=170623 RepID=A0A1I4GD89_9GAMM|nr:HlyD family efflux transporter periplasmic adaptor subunit [Azotobacter beijerinckii]SFA89098.1 putative peptide zinc metalloprotease protein [Azotobacter beijerinckii]SFL27247.1 putative peptide zinc metalloprotease protein [Azotobacter beijerinckii]
MTTPIELPAQLPPLREDLQLHVAAPNRDGSPAWTIQDPLTNAFYRIGWLEFELLARWSLGRPQEILAATAAETPLEPEEDELGELYAFLLGHQLLDIHDVRYTRYLHECRRSARAGRLRWLLHHYLFFRLPLIRPARQLAQALPWVEWVYSRFFALTVLILSALGLFLTAQQWDSFTASFMDTLSPGGLVGYLVALAVTKSLHELGHAFTATRYGLRVAHMGVAFLVLWPVLYTDTGESWRLPDRRRRLAIASAGIVSELALAGLATLAWNLSAEGDLKQALFFLASTAWLISLTLNLSPFMRFDGYFILSDAIEMPNLHERAAAMAIASLRNTLLGWHEPDPEPMPSGKRRLMIAFAYFTWVYRLMLFIGVAVAVYLLFFKLLGIFLFIVEIAWFVVRPLMKELRIWHVRRDEIAPGRRTLALALFAAAMLLLLVPWNTHLDAPGWAHPRRQHVLYSPLPARLVKMPRADEPVQAGSPLFSLEQPELDYRATVAQSASQTLEQRLRGLASLPEGEEKRAPLTQQQRLHVAQVQAEHAEAIRLQLNAPFAGVLTDIDPELAAGVWVSPQQPLATLIDPQQWEAELFVPQQALGRLAVGNHVRFYPDAQGQAPVEGRITLIESTRTARLPHPLLSSRHGGRIAALPDERGLTPRDTLYRIQVDLERPVGASAVLSGQARVEARAQSWLLEALKPILIVMIRESGF